MRNRLLVITITLFLILCSACSMSLQGDNGLSVAGNSSSNMVILSLDGTVVRGVLTDSGNATALNNWLTIVGNGTVLTSASGHTITITGPCGSGTGNLTLSAGHILVGNSSGVAEDMELTGDGAINSLGELSVYWSDMCQSADTANTATDSDTLDGQHGSYYLDSSDVVTGIEASAVYRNSNTVAKTTTSTSYVKLKEVQLNDDLAECRVYTQLSAGATCVVYCRVYVNGVAVGVAHSTNSISAVAFTDDLTDLQSGDLIQVYAYTTNASYYAKVWSEKLGYSLFVQGLGGFTLNAPLETTSDPTISVTNQDP